MTGRIESGQLCTVTPINPAKLRVGRNDYLDLINAIGGARFQIAPNGRRLCEARNRIWPHESVVSSAVDFGQAQPVGIPNEADNMPSSRALILRARSSFLGRWRDRRLQRLASNRRKQRRERLAD
jgi:hypothetical protein